MSSNADLSENLLAARLEGLVTWLVERRIQVLTFIGIVVAAALVGSVFLLRRNERVNDARTKLAYAQSMVSQRAFAEATPLLNEVLASEADRDSIRLASYLAGVSALEQNKLDDAVTLLSGTVDKSAGHPIRPLARAALGTALEQKKDFTGAVADYAAFLSETPEHFLSPRIQLSLGRANLLAGNNDDARKALEHLIDQFPTSEWAENARRLLDKNKAR